MTNNFCEVSVNIMWSEADLGAKSFRKYRNEIPKDEVFHDITGSDNGIPWSWAF